MAKIAAWSGVRAVIAAADRPGVLAGAVAGEAGIGTVLRPRETRLSARKLWIAFAVEASGVIVVDEGARHALLERRTSLLPAGVVEVRGDFVVEDAVNGVQAAKAGNMAALGLARADDEGLLAGANADLVVTSLDDVSLDALADGRLERTSIR